MNNKFSRQTNEFDTEHMDQERKSHPALDFTLWIQDFYRETFRKHLICNLDDDIIALSQVHCFDDVLNIYE